MFDVSLMDEKTRWNNLIKRIKDMEDISGSVVDIGFFEDVGLISIMKENEFGDPPRRNRPYPIPERSFMRFVFDRDLDTNFRILEKGSDDIINGIRSKKDVLTEIGKKVSNDIKKFILSGYYKTVKPNHPITIAKKGHDYPLIQTGKAVTVLTYKVGNKEPVHRE